MKYYTWINLGSLNRFDNNEGCRVSEKKFGVLKRDKVFRNVEQILLP